MTYLRDARLITEARVPMRDGVNLAATICLPAEEGRFPVLLMRSPYNRIPYVSDAYPLQGVVCVSQDCRGRYGSDGEFYPWYQEENDGLDTLDWLLAQPWCNGRIAMVGDSYLGGVQYAVARHNHPGLCGLNPRFMPADLWYHCFYCGGAFSLALVYSWLCFEVGGRSSSASHFPILDIAGLMRELPVASLDEKGTGSVVPAYRDFVTHQTRDEYWQALGWIDTLGEVTTPMLLTAGWYDYYPGETLDAFKALTTNPADPAAAANHRIVVGPWTHGINGTSVLGDLDFGPEALAANDHSDRWLLSQLKGGSPSDVMEAPIRLFVMGLNQWRDEYEWPLARTEFTNFYLHSADSSTVGSSAEPSLSTQPPGDESSGNEPPDSYTYDPGDPALTLGGNHSVGPYNPGLYELALPGPIDQRPTEARDDVLTYTSAPLGEDLEVTGPVTVKLYASSSAVDTDFVARLCDVYPDGRSINITEGCLRTRFRSREWTRIQLMEPGQVYEFEITLQATSNLFKAGHRLRVQITSSNFPLWDRNLNTGESLTDGVTSVVAHQTIFRDSRYPSHIVLPVIPATPDRSIQPPG